jgi:hypothetical protein
MKPISRQLLRILLAPRMADADVRFLSRPLSACEFGMTKP